MGKWVVAAWALALAGCGQEPERDTASEQREVDAAIENYERANRAANESLDRAIEGLKPAE